MLKSLKQDFFNCLYPLMEIYTTCCSQCLCSVMLIAHFHLQYIFRKNEDEDGSERECDVTMLDSQLFKMNSYIQG